VGAETAGIVEVVARGAGRDLIAERPMQWLAVVSSSSSSSSSSVGGLLLPASYGETSQPVHFVMMLPVAQEAPAHAVVFHLESAHCWTDHHGYHFVQAVGSLPVVKASVPDGVTFWEP
jgi:hypothetical protein